MSEKSKVILYQLFPRLFGNTNTNNTPFGTIEENGCGKFNDISDIALTKLKDFGISHIWYTGIIEHATMTDYSKYGIAKDFPQIIKGRAGSPYAIKDYYDVDPDLAEDVDNRILEFENLIQRTHKQDLKVIIDFIPNHLARNYQSGNTPNERSIFGNDDDTSTVFDPQNNFYYLPNKELRLPKEIYQKFASLIVNANPYIEAPAKATGNDVFNHKPSINDWYETIKLNYGIHPITKEKHFKPIPSTWIKMKDILLFWAAKGVDGFRCDMAEMVPVEFWTWAIKEVRKAYPNTLFIAEIYNPELYSTFIKDAAFDYLYDKVGLYDCLRDIIEEKSSAQNISNIWKSLEDLDDHMLRFLENHDEHRIASNEFINDAWKAIPAMVISATLNNGPIMIYQGQEVGEAGQDKEGFSGEDGRTSIFDYWGNQEFQKWVNNYQFDGEKLDGNKKLLREYYQKINYLSANNEAFYKGSLYDLMWVNDDYDLINPDKTYAYLRHTEDQVLLIVCSFANHEQDIRLKIPHHAFELLSIPSTYEILGRDIFMSNNHFQIEVGKAFHEGIPMQLKPWSAYVFALEKI